jgi:hypothetical protein
MSDISVTLTSGPTIDVEIIGTGPPGPPGDGEGYVQEADLAAALTDALTSYLPLDGGTVNGDLTVSSAGRLRLNRTDDVRPDSTSHAFQIGSSSSTNLAMDNDEIMARNNNAPSVLKLNADGEDVTINENVGGGKVWHEGNFNPSDYAPTIHTHDYLPTSGGTMTGDLTINKNNGAVALYLNGANTYDKFIVIKTGGLSRWALGSNSTAESGNNSGSNFIIYRYNDSGNNIGNALWISRATGVVTFANAPKVGSGEVWHGGNLQVEEGTWTPTLYGSTTAGTPSYAARSGSYRRIKNTAHVMGLVIISSKGGMSGNLRIGGLPYVSNMAAGGAVGMVSGALGLPLYLHMDSSTNYIQLVTHDTFLNDGNITDGFSLYGFSMTYAIA